MREFAILKQVGDMTIVGYDDGMVGTLGTHFLSVFRAYNTLHCAQTEHDTLILGGTGETVDVQSFPVPGYIIRAAYISGIKTWFVKGDLIPWKPDIRDYIEGRAQ